jgi:signal transduction histidine kinase
LANKDIYAIAFCGTVIAACLLWGFAAVVYRNDRKDYMHRAFALGIIFMGLWFLAGFPERILSQPNSTFALWTFRWAYITGLMGVTYFLLFSISLYLGRTPSMFTRSVLICLAALFAALSFSPLVIERATYNKDVIKTTNGALFPVVAVILFGEVTACICLVVARWSRSYGTERNWTSVILYGMVGFMAVSLVSVLIAPAIFGNDSSASYAFLGGFIPLSCLTYSIVRLRILDTRVIVHRTGVFAILAVLIAIPILLLFLFFTAVHASLWAQYVIMFLVLISLVFIAPDAWKKVRQLSSRLLFSELYDQHELVNDITTRFISNPNLPEGMENVLSVIVNSLGLEGLDVVIKPGVLSQRSWKFSYSQVAEIGNSMSVDDDNDMLPWLSDVDRMVISKESIRRPLDADDAALGSEMSLDGVAACTRIPVGSDSIGFLLIKNKISGRNLSATDIAFFAEASSRIGLFINNHSLSTRLAAQVRELKKAQEFASEIVKFTSHEFRTPATVINGFVDMLSSNWEVMDRDDREECIACISEASKRLTNLTLKFLSADKLEQGQRFYHKVPLALSDVIEAIARDLSDEQRSRFVIESDMEMTISSDPLNFQLILSNLVENAFRFSPPDQPVIFRAWKEGENAHVQVRDFGEGIPQEERQKIFEPFVRLENPSHVGGVGLGLYIVRLLTASLGIEVEISSGREGGTAMTLSF